MNKAVATASIWIAVAVAASHLKPQGGEWFAIIIIIICVSIATDSIWR